VKLDKGWVGRRAGGTGSVEHPVEGRFQSHPPEFDAGRNVGGHVPDGVVLRVERVPDPRGDVALVGVEVPEAVGVEGDRKLVGDDEVDSDALADPVREEHAGGDTPAEEVEPARTGDVRQRDRVRIGGHVVADDDELAHTRGRPPTHKRPDPSGSMSVTGLCHVCEAAPASHTCPRCGRAVCEDHWDDDADICTACAQGQTQ